MRETGDYKHLLVLALALMFGLIGFADDFIKVKKKRNLGLTGLQKLVLQVLAACLFLAGMHFTNALTYDLYIPFVREPLVHIPPLVYLALSVFIIVGCVNAVNLTDGHRRPCHGRDASRDAVLHARVHDGKAVGPCHVPGDACRRAWRLPVL